MRLDSNADFIRRGLDILRTGYPERYRSLYQCVRKVPGLYLIGNERLRLVAARGVISIRPRSDPSLAGVTAMVDPQGIIEVIDGKSTVRDLLSRELLVLKADSDRLFDINAGVRIVAEAAITSAALRGHFEAYRSWVARSARTSYSVR